MGHAGADGSGEAGHAGKVTCEGVVVKGSVPFILPFDLITVTSRAIFASFDSSPIACYKPQQIRQATQ
jgi:hypothetical protein